MTIVARFMNDESGATAIEYAAATTLGNSLSDLFNRIGGRLDNATGT